VRILDDVSRSLNEYLLIPGLTREDRTPTNVSLSAPLVRHPAGGEAPLRVALPLCSAIMEAVSSPRMAIALAQAGGIGFIHQNQPAQQQAEDVRSVKRNKAGFRHSELNVRPDAPLGEVSALLRQADTDVAARRVSDTQLAPTRSITPSSSTGGSTLPPDSRIARTRPAISSRTPGPSGTGILSPTVLAIVTWPSSAPAPARAAAGCPRAYNRRTPPSVAVRRR